MYIVDSYFVAVVMCVITMLCWGSWGNTLKLASKEWRFQLFYWDYAIGVLLLALILAFTLGSTGSTGRGFMADLSQAGSGALLNAFIGGVIFNLSNILLVAAIDIAGMAVAFPLGVGLALALGVVTTYVRQPKGNVLLLGLGVAGIVIAMVFAALAYKRLATQDKNTPVKGILLSIIAGVLMGNFYGFVVAGMAPDFANPAAGLMTPYTAVVVFSVGLLLSNFLWNSLVMIKPFVGAPVPFGDYFTKGNVRLHLIGILGGMIWNVGMSFNIIASEQAGAALSYGLGQGATLVAAFWGVFIWKEFKGAPAGTNPLLALMFLFYFLGLTAFIISKLV